ncbi:reverse transcriptase [Tanacetum coccineum]
MVEMASGKLATPSGLLSDYSICEFQGLESENPFQHLKLFMSIVDNIQADGVTKDASRFRFFHFTLKGKTKEWLDRQPPIRVTTWEQLVSPEYTTSLNEDEGWNRIEEFVQYQDDSGDEPSLPMNVLFISELTLNGRLKRAHQQLSYLTSATKGKNMKNPYLICDIYSRAHDADECDQVILREQVCLSGGDIYDDPSLLRFYPNNDVPPWGNSRIKEEGEDGPDWVIRSQFEDKLANYMMEKNFHLKRSLPQKEGDPGSFTLPCLIRPLTVKNALANLGASINFMPHSLFWKLGISELKPTRMSIQLADRSIKYPVGVCENLLVKINRFIFLVDFVVLEMDKDKLVPIILGRHFLATTRAVIYVHEGKLSLRVGSETVTFNIDKSTKPAHFHDDYLYCAHHTVKLVKEQWVDTIHHDGEWVDTNEKCNSEKIQAVSFYPRQEQVEPLEWNAPENRLKPSISEPPKLELKEFPEHLEYAFLQRDDQLPVVISSTLSIYEKSKLLKVLRNYKGEIAWSVADIKGIDSSF